MKIEYYLAPQSPWTYLGHARLERMAREHGATVQVLPMDLGQIFPISGGLPLPQRAPQRQAYRLLELRRFADHLGLPLNLHPKFFPVAGHAAARLILAVDRADGAAAAMQLTGLVLAAVWSQEQDINDASTLAALLTRCGLPSERLPQSGDAANQQAYAQATQSAIDRGVFGAPSYVIDGEIFWGQDRLDFVQRKLARWSGR